MHEDIAKQFAAGGSVKRHVECRCTDEIYVYLYEDGIHIQTQTVAIPEAWWENWPSDETVRKHVHRHAVIGSHPITDIG